LTDPTPTDDEMTPRGRPRPQETIARDDQVLSQLSSGPKTTKQLADALGISPGKAYLCIYRLKQTGQVEKTQTEGAREPSWQATGAAAPA
jgi:DNA-binding IclR family transcriptional regulator